MRLGTLLVLVPVLGLAACGGGTSSTPDAADNCTGDPRAETFYVGLDHHGDAGSLDFVLVSADPAPPARPDNTWVVQINGMSAGVVGNPLTGVSMAVTPFMPDHQHGTPIPVNITAMPTAGQYQLSPINTWMPGLWQTTIQAQSGSTTDKTVFTFCIQI
jgi:hypothetical protein